MRWKGCADTPVGTAIPPVVKIGDSVYVGDGLRKKTEESTVFKYSITLDTWSSLPKCPTIEHGLAAMNNELIVIGGRKSDKATNIVYTFRDDKWQRVLPPMPTARYLPSATSHENRLILAVGGTLETKQDGEFIRTDIVEIYKKDDSWYSTKRLPFPLTQFTTYIVGDTCYTLGGVTDGDDTYITLYTTVSSLLENAVPADGRYSTPQIPITWEKLQDKHPLTFPSLVELDGKLVAMGGSADRYHRLGTKFISAYDFATDTWVKCKGAELPLPSTDQVY